MHLFLANSTEKQSLQYVNSMNYIVCCGLGRSGGEESKRVSKGGEKVG